MNTLNAVKRRCIAPNALAQLLVLATLGLSEIALASTDSKQIWQQKIQQGLQQLLQGFDHAAVVFQKSGDKGEPLIALNKDQPLVPASTVKLVTALMAIEQWGEDRQATTDFYFDGSTSTLTAVGKGDPFLVSEEIQPLASQLQSALLAKAYTEVKNVRVDNSRFKNTSGLSWQSATSNPYDAVPSALAANFNTLNINIENGRPVSSEEQTPLTRLAWQWAAQQPGISETGKMDPLTGLPLLKPLSASIGRINLGSDVASAARYFGELLATFLWQQGTAFVGNNGVVTEWAGDADQPLPMVMLADAVTVERGTQYGDLIYTHRNSRDLSSVVAGMLKYSTNFIANNLALMLASDGADKPAGFDDFRQMAERFALERFHWQDIVLEEGAGLSLANRLSAAQLVQLTNAYESRHELLPSYKESLFGDSVFAKTGTLQSVSTLAGVIRNKSINDEAVENYTFAILLQDDSIVDSSPRDRVLQLLIESIK